MAARIDDRDKRNDLRTKDRATNAAPSCESLSMVIRIGHRRARRPGALGLSIWVASNSTKQPADHLRTLFSSLRSTSKLRFYPLVFLKSQKSLFELLDTADYGIATRQKSGAAAVEKSK